MKTVSRNFPVSNCVLQECKINPPLLGGNQHDIIRRLLGHILIILKARPSIHHFNFPIPFSYICYLINQMVAHIKIFGLLLG